MVDGAGPVSKVLPIEELLFEPDLHADLGGPYFGFGEADGCRHLLELLNGAGEAELETVANFLTRMNSIRRDEG